ncbi:T9SS type A sorting domain-containing protein, partial [bacterium]
ETIFTDINNNYNTNISTKFKNAPKFNLLTQNFNDYKKSLIGNKDSIEILKELEKIKTLDFNVDGQKLPLDFQKLIGNFKNKVLNELKLSDFLKFKPSDIKDSLGSESYEISLNYSDNEKPKMLRKIKVSKKNESTKPDEDFPTFIESKPYVKDLFLLDTINENEVIMDSNVTILNGEVINKFFNKNESEIVEIKNDSNQNEINTYDSSVNSFNYNINELIPTYDSLFDNFNYNINELIPIEISFDGKKTDFIVWYEATDDFLKNLPPNILAKINPELAAISEQTDYCDNAPIEKNDAVMDVWSGCSGAIKNMRVFPNPATNSSKVEFNLEDSRKIWIAVYDLSGKLIKSLYKAVEYKKGNFDENLNLNGITSGMYYVLVKSDKGEQALQRIIIE